MKRFYKIFLLCLIIIGFSFGNCRAGSSIVLPTNPTFNTYGSGGGYDYTAIESWKTATALNLVSLAKSYVLNCAAGIYNDYGNITGATCNASYFRVVRAAPGSERNVTFRYTGTNNIVIRLNEAYASLYNVNIQKIETTGSSTYAVINMAVSSRICGCYIGPSSTSYISNTAAYGIQTGGTNTVVVANNIIDSIYGYSLAGYGIYESGANYVNIYNCLIKNCLYGIYSVETTNVRVKNTIIKNVTTTTLNVNDVTTCLFTTGAGSVIFLSDGYHLSSSDVTAKDHGTSLVADSVFPFNDDFEGQLRPFGSAWDIGPDEFWPKASSVIFFR